VFTSSTINMYSSSDDECSILCTVLLCFCLDFCLLTLGVPSNQTLVMFNKTETKPAGKRKITIVNPKNKKWYNLEFVAVNGNVALRYYQCLA
jgi:hypothetical protein